MSYPREFEGILFFSTNKVETIKYDNGYKTFFVWESGKVTEGYGKTKKESEKSFESAINKQYKEWKIKNKW